MKLGLRFLDRRPIVVAIGGPNGSGKSTFYHAHLAETGLRFVNADVLADELDLGPYEAANAASGIRNALITQRESFIFETVLSDPVGEKIVALRELAEDGYEVVLIFIQIPDSATSIQRVSMRASQGGHDVPDDKLLSRFDRIQENLKRAIEQLPCVIVFDNSDLSHPYRHVATYRGGSCVSGKPVIA